MNQVFQSWFRSMFSDDELVLSEAITAKGEFYKQLGPFGPGRATIFFRIEPAETFEVMSDFPSSADQNQEAYMEAGVFGLLDRVLLASDFPKKQFGSL